MHYQAYESIIRLRFSKIQAARDLFYMHTLLEAENKMKIGQSKVLEMIKVPRNRRAMVASEIVMFMQQFCGVNVIGTYFTRRHPTLYTVPSITNTTFQPTTPPTSSSMHTFQNLPLWQPPLASES